LLENHLFKTLPVVSSMVTPRLVIGAWLGVVLTVFLFLSATIPSPVAAQAFPTEATFVKNFARPGQPTMIVYLWGNVAQAGLWRVEPNVDLIELLTAAQVPGVGTRTPGIRQNIFVNVYRSTNSRQRIYRRDITKLLEEAAEYPTLQPQDIVEIEIRERRSFGLRTVSAIIGTISSITLLALRLTSGR